MAFSINGFVANFASGAFPYHNILAYRGFQYEAAPPGGGYTTVGTFPASGTFAMSLFFQQGAYVQYYTYTPPGTTGG